MENINQDLFSGNKYFNWYWNIVNRAKDRILERGIYFERHHIYPLSIYGKNKDLVKLTAKEHYIVHLVLWWGLRTKFGIKDSNTRKMASAFNCMCRISQNQTRIKIDSIRYELLKIARHEAQKDQKVGPFSEEHKNNMRKPKPEGFSEICRENKLGDKNPNYGKSTWNTGLTKETDIRLKETGKKISKSRLGIEPWNKGKRGLQTAWNKGLRKNK